MRLDSCASCSGISGRPLGTEWGSRCWNWVLSCYSEPASHVCVLKPLFRRSLPASTLAERGGPDPSKAFPGTVHLGPSSPCLVGLLGPAPDARPL